MRVLVTGGAGFIGSHIVDRHLRKGDHVRVLDSLEARVHPRGKPPYLRSDVEFIQGSILDRWLLKRALDGIDVVSHQAAYQDYMPDFSKFLSVNAVGTALLYEVIVEHQIPVKKIVVASSQAVYGEGQYKCTQHGFFLPAPRSQGQLQRGEWEVQCPECHAVSESVPLRESHVNPYNQYAVSKLAEEKTALGLGWLHNIPTVALRYSITQGMRQSLFNQYSGVCRIFFSRAMSGLPLVVYEDGRQKRDFVHVQDVVDAYEVVLTSDAANYRAFNVGSGHAMTVLDYADAVAKRLGREISVHVSGEYRRGDNRHSVSSVSELTGLGWSPRRTLANILDDFLAWVDANGGIPADAMSAYAHMKQAGVVVGV
ncbi:MAG TPA: NAD-dependent epimerase/dehydratase family protein [Terriglobales bacterium]|nr:NAD-dependent epimerase/dehydratase family protein [Terriglobales bacterium]